MQNNEAVGTLYDNHHDNLINISNAIIEDLDEQFEFDQTLEAEDIVQELYVDLLEQSDFIENGFIDDDNPDLGYVFIVLRSKLNTIIINNCLVD